MAVTLDLTSRSLQCILAVVQVSYNMGIARQKGEVKRNEMESKTENGLEKGERDL